MTTVKGPVYEFDLGHFLFDKKAEFFFYQLDITKPHFFIDRRKTITTGEGGIITTNDKKLAHAIRALRNHGLDPDAPEADFIIPGYNYRMTEFQAALGISQLNKIDRINTRRKALASNYTKLLKGTNVETPKEITDSSSIYQSYVVLLPSKIADRRKDIIINRHLHPIL